MEQIGAALERIRAQLFALADEKLRAFNLRIIPEIDTSRFIGVRTPELRALAKSLRGSADAALFLTALPHDYFEENQLHAFLISDMRDYEACIAAVNAFLPYVDNWATCDQLSPGIFKKHLPELRAQIELWMGSKEVYTARFGIEMLMRWYLDERFDASVLESVAALRSDAYYLNMMMAWFFATALAKQYEATLPYIENHRLDEWTHNKTIQKAIESRRISNERKNNLRNMKVSAKKLS